MAKKKRPAIEFGVLSSRGNIVGAMSIDISKIKSPDPLAFAYGYFQGKTGIPKAKNKGLAPEYLRGYEKGKRERKKLKKVV